jgi:hypothetical protein
VPHELGDHDQVGLAAHQTGRLGYLYRKSQSAW